MRGGASPRYRYKGVMRKEFPYNTGIPVLYVPTGTYNHKLGAPLMWRAIT